MLTLKEENERQENLEMDGGTAQGDARLPEPAATIS
jgi:hypothetical protein